MDGGWMMGRQVKGRWFYIYSIYIYIDGGEGWMDSWGWMNGRVNGRVDRIGRWYDRQRMAGERRVGDDEKMEG